MNVCSEDIKDVLISDSSLGLVFKTNLHIAKEPSLPINTVTIFDTQGYPDDVTLDSNRLETPSIQIRIRDISYPHACAVGESIKDFLYNQSQSIINGTLYSSITCVNGPHLLDWDENGNVRVIMNFNIKRR